jgi:hypothetical protein
MKELHDGMSYSSKGQTIKESAVSLEKVALPCNLRQPLQVLATMQLERLPALFAALVLAATLSGQAAQTPTDSRAMGTVTKMDSAAHSMTLKTDAGQEIAVTLAPNANFRRVAPGETDLRNAATIAISDVGVGDRVLARGKPLDNQGVAATLIVVMSQGDIAKKQAGEQADWDKRGVGGLVASVAGDSVTIETRTLAGTKQVAITPLPNAIIRRYAPDSINFADAKPAKLSEIRVKDQVRARGDKVDDGTKVAAAEIVFGTFKTSAGVILSIDPQTNEVRVNDLETKKPVVVKISTDSKLRKLQPQMAQTIASRVHGDAAGAAAGGPPAGTPPQGGGRGPGGPGGFGGPGGGGGGFARGGGGDLSQMLERSPAATLADLKAGDAIVVLSTEGATQGKITAITLLAGVEPILTRPGSREMSLGGWSLDVGGGGGE